jgi:hypothetical protein
MLCLILRELCFENGFQPDYTNTRRTSRQELLFDVRISFFLEIANERSDDRFTSRAIPRAVPP